MSILALVLAFPGLLARLASLSNLFLVFQQVTVVPVDFTGLEQLTGDGALGDQFTQLISQIDRDGIRAGDPVDVAPSRPARWQASTSACSRQIKHPVRSMFRIAPPSMSRWIREKAQALLDELALPTEVLPESIDGTRSRRYPRFGQRRLRYLSQAREGGRQYRAEHHRTPLPELCYPCPTPQSQHLTLRRPRYRSTGSHRAGVHRHEP